MRYLRKYGGAEGDRTPDLCNAIAKPSAENRRNPPFFRSAIEERAANMTRIRRSLTAALPRTPAPLAEIGRVLEGDGL